MKSQQQEESTHHKLKLPMTHTTMLSFPVPSTPQSASMISQPRASMKLFLKKCNNSLNMTSMKQQQQQHVSSVAFSDRKSQTASSTGRMSSDRNHSIRQESLRVKETHPPRRLSPRSAHPSLISQMQASMMSPGIADRPDPSLQWTASSNPTPSQHLPAGGMDTEQGRRPHSSQQTSQMRTIKFPASFRCGPQQSVWYYKELRLNNFIRAVHHVMAWDWEVRCVFMHENH